MQLTVFKFLRLWFELISGALTIGVLSFLIITSQTLKAARTNPAQVLKNE
jgi:hypothetical protein